jgi:hypothetical protein
MHNTNAPTLRRSSRVPIAVSILVTSLEPGARFSEVCQTLVVSAHGCALRSPMKLEAGAPLHFHSQEGRETTARVVDCQQIGSDRQGWTLAASFDKPENFWGLDTCPKDWARLAAPAGEKLAPRLSSNKPQAIPPDQMPASVKMVLDKIRKQLSDEHLKAVLAELVRPLETEMTEVREKLARAATRNRFEVSLTQIPPELEEQLELRLKKDLAPQVLQQARQQSEQVLEAAKAAIDQKTRKTHDEFVQRVTVEMQAVEQRAQGISTEVGKNLRDHLNRGLGDVHLQVADAGNRLKRLSEDLLRVLEQSLGQAHDARTGELERLRATVASESSRLQQQVADLDRRMAKLDESARRLESGLDKRLSQMAADTLSSARSNLESALEVALAELETRNAQELGNQLDEACANLKIIQKGIEASVAESLKMQAAEVLQSFEQAMDDLAQQSVDRWRMVLAGGLNSLVRTLGEQFVLRAENDGAAGQR